jgi:hypothetical protein
VRLFMRYITKMASMLLRLKTGGASPGPHLPLGLLERLSGLIVHAASTGVQEPHAEKVCKARDHSDAPGGACWAGEVAQVDVATLAV